MPTAAGLDIARGKWALVEISWDDVQELQLTGKTIEYGEIEIRDAWDVAIADVPIGLVQDHEAAVSKQGRSGDRPVDRGARRWCRSSSSVFPPPTEGQFQTGLQEHQRAAAALTKTAQRRNLEAVKPGGLSKQSLELLPAIDDAAKLKSHHPAQVFESHPEVVFSVLAGVIQGGRAGNASECARPPLGARKRG